MCVVYIITHVWCLCVCLYNMKKVNLSLTKRRQSPILIRLPFTLVWLICWWQIVKLFEIIANLWISFVIIFLILPYHNGPPLGHINAKTQELPGALPPGPPPGRCPWTPPGALKRAPGPPAVKRSLRSH